VKPIALVSGLFLLCGCATHPITGRDQILALPAVQVAYADVGFALSTGALLVASLPPCGQDCGGESLEHFAGRVRMIGTQLETSARGVSPELFGRIDRFQIEVNRTLGAGTASSPGGRIALGSDLAALKPTDTVIAFLIAREMAHVIARHGEENSGAAIVTSVLGMLLPGISTIARFVATTLASSALKSSWATRQRQEADEIALAILERSGRSVFSVALDLESGVKQSHLPDGEWSVRFGESTQRIALIAAVPPRYAVLGH